MADPRTPYRTSPEDMVLPFPALVGQEQVKRALLMLAVNPRLSGLLIRGEKGTAKSTAARGLSRLMPTVRVNEGCLYGCPADRERSWCPECVERKRPKARKIDPPFETLPLGITEDQLLGTFDLEKALTKGEKSFEPGLLARVNQGVLYVDEVNLLDDHIVDFLLDCAASGVNVVAREGITLTHIRWADESGLGTMNPEEGEIRPQLQDRFGLCAELKTLEDPDTRADIIDRCLDFERDPIAFREKWSKEEKSLTRSIVKARKLLPSILPGRRWHRAAARLSINLGVHGHRADILMIKAAVTIAALDGRKEIRSRDLEDAAPLVYPHRLRRKPFDDDPISPGELSDQAREAVSTSAPLRKKKGHRR